MNPSTPPPAPQSFEERISQVRLWTLIPVLLVPLVAWAAVIKSDVAISPAAARGAWMLLTFAFALGWWILKAAPRPCSVRATLGRPLDARGWGALAAALLGVFCVRSAWWSAPYYWRVVHSGDMLGSSYALELTRSIPTAFDGVLVSMMLTPVTEELLFRATFFRKWRARFGPGKGALLCSAIFAVLHVDLVSGLFLGLTFALLYTRTRSLWAPLVLHIINNSVWVGRSYWWDSPRLRLESWWQFGVFTLVLLVGVGVWLQFVIKSWRTLGDPLPPDSWQASPVENSSSLPEPVRAS